MGTGERDARGRAFVDLPNRGRHVRLRHLCVFPAGWRDVLDRVREVLSHCSVRMQANDTRRDATGLQPDSQASHLGTYVLHM